MSGIRYAAPLPGASRDTREAAIAWCTEHFGPATFLKGRWFALDYTIQFRDEEDRLFYTLKWN